MFSILIIALVGALFGPMLGPQLDQVKDSVAAWDTAVKKVVTDKEKQTEALALVDSVKEELKVRRTQFASALETFLKTDAVYGATAEDYEAAVVTLNTIWSEQEAWLVDQRFDLRDLMTDGEWIEAIAIVDGELQGQWDKLKEAQVTLKENLRKREKKAARHH